MVRNCEVRRIVAPSIACASAPVNARRSSVSAPATTETCSNLTPNDRSKTARQARGRFRTTCPPPGAKDPCHSGPSMLGSAVVVLGNFILKCAIGINRNMYFRDPLSLGHAGEEFTGDLRQKRAGEDVIHVARPTFHFGAALGDGGDQGVIIGELGPIVLLQPGADPIELQHDDTAHDVVGDWKVRYGDQTP